MNVINELKPGGEFNTESLLNSIVYLLNTKAHKEEPDKNINEINTLKKEIEKYNTLLKQSLTIKNNLTEKTNFLENENLNKKNLLLEQLGSEL